MGILRRAKSRGKQLPKQLKDALMIQAEIVNEWDIISEEKDEVKSYHINQRNEGIDLDGLSGALMATRNMQMQTFVTEPLMVLNDQGGERMDVTEEVVGTLRASMSSHVPIVMGSTKPNAEMCEDLSPTITASAGLGGGNAPYLYDNHPKDARYNGPLDVCPTLAARIGTGGNNGPLISNPVAYNLDSKESNSAKSTTPNSGCRVTEQSRTIDTTNPKYSKNQGGIAIVQESYCIASNTINRQNHNGGNGQGVQKDISYTITTGDVHAIYSPEPYQNIVGTLMQRDHKGVNTTYVDQGKCIVAPYQEQVGALCSGDCKGANNQYVSQDKCIVDNPTVYGQSAFADYKEGCTTLRAQGGDNGGAESLCGSSENLTLTRNLVRRLTPLECERLQGFPDGWTDIPKASDSPRYKALGNSVCIQCVNFVLNGIALCLNKQKERLES